MAELRSTGYKNAKAGLVAAIQALIVGTTFAFVDGGAGNDSITDSGNGFVTAGFQVGDKIKVEGSTSNDGTYTVLTVAAGTLGVATGSLTTEAAGDTVAIAAARGGSIRDIFDFGVIHLYSGSRPSSADSTETGTLLAVITNGGAAFTPGTKDAAGLRFGDAASGVISPLSGQTWKTDAILATGTIGYGVLYDNARTQGLSTSAVRTMFTVGTSGADMVLSRTSVTLGEPFTLTSATITVS
jgi:hypothetical protein